MRFHAYAPTRIDLAGGTLDIWPLYLFHPGALTVNLGVTRYAHAVVESAPKLRGDRRIVLVSQDTGEREEFASLAALRMKRRYRLPLLAHLVRHFLAGDSSPGRVRPERVHRERAQNDRKQRGLTLTTWSEAPAGAGLGGSSALAVAVCVGLDKMRRQVRSRTTQGQKHLRAHGWIALARDIEARVLGVPTGEQDHYPAVYGGVGAVHLEPRQTWWEPLRVPVGELESRLLLVYTGKPRRSGINNWQVLKNYLDGDRRLHRNFLEIAAIATALRAALVKKDWAAVARLLRREWQIRRRNSPGISTPLIDCLAAIGRRHGAAAKVCGAGGGGCVVFFCAPQKRAALAQALAAAGATLLPFRIARRGVQVEGLP